MKPNEGCGDVMRPSLDGHCGVEVCDIHMLKHRVGPASRLDRTGWNCTHPVQKTIAGRSKASDPYNSLYICRECAAADSCQDDPSGRRPGARRELDGPVARLLRPIW